MTKEKEIPAEVLEKAARAMEPMTFTVYDQVESGEYRPAPGYQDIPAKVAKCRKYAAAALTAIDYCGLVEQNQRMQEALEKIIRLDAEAAPEVAEVRLLVAGTCARQALAKEQPHD